METNRNLGEQPLKDILESLSLTRHGLVEASTEQLTHRMVTRGCKGRRLTANAQGKILNALNSLSKDKKYSLPELFNYTVK